jgi:hypothetical protein
VMNVEHLSWTQPGGCLPRASAPSTSDLNLHLGSGTSPATLGGGRSHTGFCADEEICTRAVWHTCAIGPRAATAITKAAA